MRNEVIVGNVGTVIRTDNCLEAHRYYLHYMQLSREGHGRVYDEPVTWFRDGEIYREYLPEIFCPETKYDPDSIAESGRHNYVLVTPYVGPAFAKCTKCGDETYD